MMISVYATYDVEEIVHCGGHGCGNDIRLLDTFETYTEAYHCAMKWKEEHPDAIWTSVRIRAHYRLPSEITEF